MVTPVETLERCEWAGRLDARIGMAWTGKAPSARTARRACMIATPGLYADHGGAPGKCWDVAYGVPWDSVLAGLAKVHV